MKKKENKPTKNTNRAQSAGAMVISMVFCFVHQMATGQFFEEKFDALDDEIGVIDVGFSTDMYANANALFTEGAAPMLEAYIKMYQVTSNDKYLEKMIIQSKNIQDRRDDEPGMNNDLIDEVVSRDGSDLIINRERPNSPTWSQAKVDGVEWYANIRNGGRIASAMAEFIYLVKVEEPALSSNILPTLPATHPSNALTISTYGEYADWLMYRIFETINYYDDPIHHDGTFNQITEWRKPTFRALGPLGYLYLNVDKDLDFNTGPFFYTKHISGGWYAGSELNDWNMQHAMAKTMVFLRKTLKEIAPGDPRIGYLDAKLGILARNFKENIQLVGDHYEWTFRPTYTCPGGLSSCAEDISHAADSGMFPFLAYKNGLKFSNGTPLFTELDIDRFSRSITESAYSQPLRILNSIEGSDFFYSEEFDGAGYYSRTNFLREALGRWLNFTEYDTYIGGYDYSSGDIYQMASEIFLDEYILENKSFKEKAEYLIGISHLAFYQKNFNPVGVNRMSGAASNWAGASGGDFDNDGVDEFVAVRNYDGNFYIYEYVEDHLLNVSGPVDNVNTRAYEYQIKLVASETSPGSASNWADVVAGNFDDSHPGDEFVAVRNLDGKFFSFEYNGSSISSTSSYSMTPGQKWVGLASGDFDNDGKVEFAALEKATNRLYVFTLSGGAITPDAAILNNGFYVGSGDWSGLASGDFDNDDQAEIVSANNSNGELVIFKVASGYLGIDAKNTDAGTGSNWTDITGGDFDGDQVDEFIAHRKVDGTARIYEMDNDEVVSIGKEQFTGGQEMNVWGSGNFVPSLKNTREEIIALRNFDGAQFMYSLEGMCKNGHNCPTDLNGLVPTDPNNPNSGSSQILVNGVLYPNPTKNQSTFSFEMVQSGNVKIDLFDDNGVQRAALFDKHVKKGEAQTLLVNRGNLNKGMYYLLVRTETGNVSFEIIFE